MFNVREIKGLALLLILLLAACNHNDDDDVVVDPPVVEVSHSDLITAVNAEDAAKVKTILKDKPNLVNKVIPSATKDAGLTALHVAARDHDSDNVVEALIDGGANVNALGENGNTPLIYAAKENTGTGVAAIVAALLGVDGIQVNLKESDKGRTALHWAALQNSKAVVTLLVSPTTGASLKLADTEGWTALGHANARTDLGTEKKAFLALLRPEEPTYSEALITALGTGDATAATAVEGLLAKDPNIVDGLIPATSTNGGLTALHVAAKEHASADVAKALIAGGADVNKLGENGNTPLIYAARDNTGAGVAEIVKALLDEDDSNVDAVESVKSRTALHWAALQNSLAVVQKLIDEGADLTLTDADSKTILALANERADGAVKDAIVALVRPTTATHSVALLLAVRKGDDASTVTEAVTEVNDLLAKDPNIVNGVIPTGTDAGLTALHVAAKYNVAAGVVSALIAKGANVNALDEDGNTPLIYAARDNTGADAVAIVEALVNGGASLTATDDDDKTALELANARTDGAKDAVVGALTPKYNLALITAVRLGTTATSPDEHAAAVTAVTDALAANSNIVDGVIASPATEDLGLTALHVAARDNVAADVVQALIDGGANVNALGENGNTPLIYAAQRTGAGVEDIVEALLGVPGVKVNAVESVNSRTALHWAALQSTEAVVRLLVATPGVSVRLTDGANKRALDLANDRVDLTEAEKAPIIALLTPTESTALIAAVRDETEAEVIRLLEASPNIVNGLISSGDDEGLTALHVAARDNDASAVVKALLARAADVTLTHTNGNTALIYAARDNTGAETAEIVKALLGVRGVSVDAVETANSRTALHWAALQNTAAVVTELVNGGADVTLDDNTSKTALELANGRDDSDAEKAGVIDALKPAYVTALVALLGTGTANEALAVSGFLLKNTGIVNGVIPSGDNAGLTALHVAAKDHAEAYVVAALLSSYANPALLANGDTPLILAAQNDGDGTAAIVTALLGTTGANINVQGADGRTALHWAAHQNTVDVVRALAEATDASLTLKDSDGYTALGRASARENLGNDREAFLALLRPTAATYSAELIAALGTGTTANADAVNALLAKDPNIVDGTDSDGRTALHLAARDHTEANVVNALITAGADAKLAATNKNTALIYAAKNTGTGTGVGDIVTALLAELDVADVNALGENDRTALHWAALQNTAEVVNLLVAEGADLTLTDDADKTALNLADTREDLGTEKEAFLALVRPAPAPDPATYNAALITAVRKGDDATTISDAVTEVNNLLTSNPEYLNGVIVAPATVDVGLTALHVAAKYNTGAEVIAALLAKNPDLTLLDTDSKTALTLANDRTDGEPGKDAIVAALTPAYVKALIAALGTGGAGHAAAVTNLLTNNPEIVNGVIPTGETDEGFAALHVAARDHTAVFVVNALLAQNPDLELVAGGSVHTAWGLANDRTDTNKDAIVDALKPAYVKALIALLGTGTTGDAANVSAFLTKNIGIVDEVLPTDAGTDAGLAALHVAALRHAEVNVVDALLTGGATAALETAGGNTALIYAAQNVNTGADAAVAIVTSLLAKDDSNVDAKETVEGRTALHWAARSSSLAVVRTLVDASASLTLKDDGGYTALGLANARTDLGTGAEAFLALVKPTDPTYNDDLVTAATAGNLAEVNALLEKDPNIVNGDQFGLTALHLAVSNNIGVDVVNALLTAGADATFADLRANTALIYAARENSGAGAVAIVDALLGRLDAAGVNAKGEQGRTALHFAALRSSVDVVNLLVGATGVDLTLLDTDAKTALTLANDRTDGEPGKDAIVEALNSAYVSALIAAVRGGNDAATATAAVTTVTALLTNHPEIVDERIPAGAEDAGLTALHVAAANNIGVDVVNALLTAGADAALAATSKDTPLIYAAQNVNGGADAIVTALLGKLDAADVNVKGEQGRTALHFAALGNVVSVVTSLVGVQGVDLTLLDTDDKTALTLANDRTDGDTGKDAIVAALKSAYVSALIAAVRGGNDAATATAAVTTVTALLTNHPEIVDERIPAGAEDAGLTALHVAAKYNAGAEVVDALLAENADQTLLDGDGKTALELAEARTVAEPGRDLIVDALTLPAATHAELITAVRKANVAGDAAAAAVEVTDLLDGNSTFLDQAIDAGETDEGLTALHVAAKYNVAADVVSALLAKNPDVTLLDGSGTDSKTALGLANARTDAAVKQSIVDALKPAYVTALVALLGTGTANEALAVSAFLTKNIGIVNGVIPSGTDAGLTALHVAAKEHVAPDVVAALIAGLANTALLANGDTPLILAAQNDGAGTAAIVTALLGTTGANINVQGADGRTALHWAAHQNTVDVVRVLAGATGVSLNLKDSDGYTALGRANARQNLGDATARKTFLDLVTPATPTYSTHLVLAATAGNLVEVNALLEKDPNIVNGANNAGLRALHWAVLGNSNTNVLEALLTAGANVKAAANNGNTALIYAAKENATAGVAAIVTALLGRLDAADVNAQGERSQTALHWAALRGKVAVVSLLVPVQGLDVTLEDVDGDTAWKRAYRRDATDGVKANLLAALKPAYVSALIAAVRAGNTDAPAAGTAVATFLTNNAGLIDEVIPSGAADAGLTALHVAAKYNAGAEVVNALLAENADQTLLDGAGNTALELAEARTVAEPGRDAIVDALTPAGAVEYSADLIAAVRAGAAASANNDGTAWDTAVGDVNRLLGENSNIVNGVIPTGLSDADEGSTALHLAAAGHNLPAIFEALLTAGAVHTLTDGDGKTALELALVRPDAYRYDFITPLSSVYSAELITKVRRAGESTVTLQANLDAIVTDVTTFLTANPHFVNGLIPSGATDEGLTALHIAARDSKVGAALVTALRNAGADKRRTVGGVSGGATALDLANARTPDTDAARLAIIAVLDL